VPYYLRNILPDVLDGERVIVVAHGNSLRALIMAMEGLSPAEILSRELLTGVPIIYRLKSDSRIEGREILDR
jgi:2,3-bisphosphoglycerate-dependent phosphoglycerate mutase